MLRTRALRQTGLNQLNIFTYAPLLLPLGLAAGVAVLLHTCGARSEAAWIVPAAWIWTAVGLTYVQRTRDHLPGIWPLLAVALLMRLVLVGTPLHLSDDLYRYLFEGLALNQGYSPFHGAPADLAHLAPALAAQVNHPEVPSAYPPLALAWFRLLDLLGGTPWIAQIATALVDVGTVALLATCSPAGRAGAWVYALHPLAVIESGAGAHVDVLGVAVLTLGLAAARRFRDQGEWLGIWLGTGVKLFPIVLLPWMIRARHWRHSLLWLLLGPLALGAGLLVMVPLDSAVLGGLSAYAEHWSFNGFLFPWLSGIFGWVTRPLLVLGAGATLVLASGRSPDLSRFWLIAGLVFLLTSPTVHPWYALWVLAPVAWNGDLGLAWIPTSVLGSYAVLSTWDAATASWTEPWWLWWLTWSPVAGVLLAWLRRRARPPASAESAPPR